MKSKKRIMILAVAIIGIALMAVLSKNAFSDGLTEVNSQENTTVYFYKSSSLASYSLKELEKEEDIDRLRQWIDAIRQRGNIELSRDNQGLGGTAAYIWVENGQVSSGGIISLNQNFYLAVSPEGLDDGTNTLLYEITKEEKEQYAKLFDEMSAEERTLNTQGLLELLEQFE